MKLRSVLALAARLIAAPTLAQNAPLVAGKVTKVDEFAGVRDRNSPIPRPLSCVRSAALVIGRASSARAQIEGFTAAPGERKFSERQCGWHIKSYIATMPNATLATALLAVFIGQKRQNETFMRPNSASSRI